MLRAFEDDNTQLKQIDEGLWLIVEKCVATNVRANAWVIEGEDADLVIDGGWGVVEWPMEQLFPDRDKPLWFAATHSHCDHINQAYQFSSRRFGHALAQPVMTAPDALNTNAQPWTPQLSLIAPGYEHLDFDEHDYGNHFKPAPLTDLLGEGDRIDLGGGVVLDVMETPGHSKDSLTFVDKARRWIFPGDVLISAYIVDVLPDSDKIEVLQSHQRLMSLDFKMNFGGHRDPLDRHASQIVAAKYAARKEKEGVSL